MTKLEFALEFANQMEVLRRGHFADWEDLKRANRLLDAVREIDSCVRYFKAKVDDKDNADDPLNVQCKALVKAFDESPDPLTVKARELFDQLSPIAQSVIIEKLKRITFVDKELFYDLLGIKQCNK